MLQKLYPSGVGAPPTNSFKLIFLAEGYTSNQRHLFMSAISDFYDWLLATPPFNSTRYNPGWLTVYAGFQTVTATGASTAGGPAGPGVATAGRTVFESALSVGGTLTVNAARVTTVINGESLRVHGAARPLPDLLCKERRAVGRSGGLIVLLLPAQSTGAEMDHAPAAGEYHFIATTVNGVWHQVVLRAICENFGLEGEYELGGAANLEPLVLADRPAGFNLEYHSTVPGSRADTRNWRKMYAPGGLAGNATVHTAAPYPPTMPTVPATPDKIEFWEGGGGFRTKVYRSAHDCLMRRRSADPVFPLMSKPVPLCLVCRNLMRGAIA